MRGGYSKTEQQASPVDTSKQPAPFTYPALQNEVLRAEDAETVARLLEEDRVELPPKNFSALLDDLMFIKEEDLGHTTEGAYVILKSRIGGAEVLLRYTNTLIPPRERVAA